jgi:hypothetical protein
MKTEISNTRIMQTWSCNSYMKYVCDEIKLICMYMEELSKYVPHILQQNFIYFRYQPRP